MLGPANRQFNLQKKILRPSDRQFNIQNKFWGLRTIHFIFRKNLETFRPSIRSSEKFGDLQTANLIFNLNPETFKSPVCSSEKNLMTPSLSIWSSGKKNLEPSDLQFDNEKKSWDLQIVNLNFRKNPDTFWSSIQLLEKNHETPRPLVSSSEKNLKTFKSPIWTSKKSWDFSIINLTSRKNREIP